jgi:molybdate transport system substrate-binding protein
MLRYKNIVLLIACFFSLTIKGKAQDHQYDPPWNTPPQSKVMFTVPGIDNVPDLFGDINDPQLVVFFAGNQFMCVGDLLAAFKKEYPRYERIFVETLPPGILAKQIEGGSITIGNMRITLKPDIYTDGKNQMVKKNELFSKTEVYASNDLAIMVQKGNPKGVKGLADLGKPDIRVSMPNPAFESIGKRIEDAYIKAGGETLLKSIMDDKVKDSSTFLTQIHHRQTPMRIMYNQSDAAPVWYSEAYYQKMIGHPVDMVEIPQNENIKVTYVAGLLKNAPHLQAAKDFMDFLLTPTAKDIYRQYGFNTK